MVKKRILRPIIAPGFHIFFYIQSINSVRPNAITRAPGCRRPLYAMGHAMGKLGGRTRCRYLEEKSKPHCRNGKKCGSKGRENTIPKYDCFSFIVRLTERRT